MINLGEYKLSIIVPTFNLEDKVTKAFRSIEKQTIGFENIEVIFVDDKSDDRTLRILNNYASHYKNVCVHSTQENSGFAGKPRNIGLEHATSDFVMFLDGDDELLRNSCEVMYNKIYYDNCDVVVGGQINVFDGIHQHNPALYYSEERVFENPIDIELLNISPAITAKIFKRQMLNENNIRFLEGIPGQDLVFLIEALLNSKRTVTLNDFYVYFRNVSHTSVTFNINERYLYGLINAYTLVCELLEKFNVPFEIQEVVFFKHLSFFTTQILRTSSSKEITSEKIREILNSEEFKSLSQKDVFTNNETFRQYFNNMANQNYENHNLLKKLMENKTLNYHDRLSDNFNQLNQKYDKLNNDFTSEVNRLNELNSNLNNECSSLNGQIANLNNINEELNNDKINLNNQINNLNNEKNNLNNQINDLNNDKTHLNNQINDLNNINENLRNESDDLKSKNEELNNLNSELSDDNVNLKNRVVDLKVVNEELQDNFAELKEELDYLKKQQSRIKDQNNYFKNNNSDLIKENNELQKELDEIKSSKLWKLKNRL